MIANKLAASYAPVIGRALLAALFLQSGWDKVFNFQKVAGAMAAKALPLPEALLLASAVIVLAGGAMILFGWHARWAALVLVVWMIPVTLAFHAFWTYPPEQVFNQTNHFLKNMVVIGFLLHIIGIGSGPHSLNDDRWGDATAKT